jgi:SPX domain protein involved in polyphosphate accumulation
MNMSQDQLQGNRLELKFVVSEAIAKQVSAAARNHLVPDRFSAGRPDSCYPVHSLYLDSDGLDSYWATVHRKDSRFKLRVRFYEEHATSPAYVEVKQHANGRTLKQRCPVPRRQLPAVLAGKWAEDVWNQQEDPKHQAALDTFIRKVKFLDAAPKVHVAYRREAYVSSDGNSIRLTLDREIRCEIAAGVRVSTRMRRPHLLCENAVVIEFKVVGTEPDWFREMVLALGLKHGGFAKYVAAVAQQGLHTTPPKA